MQLILLKWRRDGSLSVIDDPTLQNKIMRGQRKWRSLPTFLHKRDSQWQASFTVKWNGSTHLFYGNVVSLLYSGCWLVICDKSFIKEIIMTLYLNVCENTEEITIQSATPTM
jgi:hypothetical protein